jgi:general secretion pathway protein F
MLKALGLSARSTGNSELEASILGGAERIAEGQRLSASLEKFPPVFIQLVSTGEKSGRLPESLSRAADSYEEEFDRKVTNFVSLLEPAMIIVMGLVVLFIVLAIVLPMFQLNQLIK